MPSLQEIKSSNATLSKQNPSLSLTAVFIGATSGIGHATLRSFAQHIPNPTALIIGRSAARFAPHLQALRAVNPNGTFTFIEHPIELLRDVDATSRLIAEALGGKKIHLLFQSQGYISFAGREPNADGLDRSVSLRYHGRVRFTRNLLPFMTEDARVVSILAGGQEGKVFAEDLGLERNYSVGNSMAHFATLMTLSYDALAAEPGNEGRTFVHAFPGVVSTGLLGKSAGGVLGWLFRWVVEPVLGLFVAQPVGDVGERMLWYGVGVGFGEAERGTRCVAVDEKSEVQEVETLKGYREGGMKEKVVEEEGRVWERAAA